MKHSFLVRFIAAFGLLALVAGSVLPFILSSTTK
jgi:hypothetical protein